MAFMIKLVLSAVVMLLIKGGAALVDFSIGWGVAAVVALVVVFLGELLLPGDML